MRVVRRRSDHAKCPCRQRQTSPGRPLSPARSPLARQRLVGPTKVSRSGPDSLSAKALHPHAIHPCRVCPPRWGQIRCYLLCPSWCTIASCCVRLDARPSQLSCAAKVGSTGISRQLRLVVDCATLASISGLHGRGGAAARWGRFLSMWHLGGQGRGPANPGHIGRVDRPPVGLDLTAGPPARREPPLRVA